MLTVTLTANQVHAIASLHHITPSGKNRMVTPILDNIQVVFTADTYTAIATDRYRVAEVSGKLTEPVDIPEGESHEVLIDSLAWQTASQAVKKRHIPFLDIEFDPEDAQAPVEFQDGVLTVLAEWRSAGNYPPVAKLFPEEEPHDELPAIGINLVLLAGFDKVRSESEQEVLASYRDKSLTMRFTKKEGKPGPVLLTRHGLDTFRGLIQPGPIL